MRTLILALLLGACGGKLSGGISSRVLPIDRALFETLAMHTRIAVLPVDFSDVKVMTQGGTISENEAFAGKQESRASWEGDKAGISEHFQGGLAPRRFGIEFPSVRSMDEARKLTPIALQMKVTAIDAGSFVGFGGVMSDGASKYTATYTLLRTQDGQALYSFEDAHFIFTRGYGAAASGTRLRMLTDQVATKIAQRIRIMLWPDA